MNRKLTVSLVATGIIIESFWIFFSTTMHPSVSVPQIFIRKSSSGTVVDIHFKPNGI